MRMEFKLKSSTEIHLEVADSFTDINKDIIL